MKIRHIILFTLLTLTFAGCGNMRYLKSDEVLHNKTKIKIENNEKWTDDTTILPANLKNDLYNLTTPKPNKRWLGFIKLNLWFFNRGNINGKGIKGWMARQLGEPPVLLDSMELDRSAQQMQSYLFNKGFYHNKVDFQVSKGKKATVTYVAKPNDRYYINKLEFPKNTDSLTRKIIALRSSGSLKTNQAFDIDVLDAERNRLADKLQEEGYFGFNKKYLHFKVDSSATQKNVDLSLQILPSELDSMGVHYRYFINNIYINASYNNSNANKSDTTKVADHIFYIANNNAFKPKAIADLIDFENGKLFDKRSYISSQNNLLNLGVFKFVNIGFKHTNHRIDTLQHDKLLDVNIKLNIAKKYLLSSELEANSRQNVLVGDNFLGTALSTSLTNKNTFKGGENLTFNIIGGVEFDLRKNNELINTSSLNTQLSLTFPKFLLPIKTQFKQSRYNPKTKISLSNSLINRINDYTINATELAMNYQWQRPNGISHTFSPLAVSYFNILKIQDSFQAELQSNIRLQKSFEEYIILGASYAAVITNNYKNHKHIFYYRPRLEVAGNFLYLTDQINPKQILSLNGVAYAQYVKLDSDFRIYFDVDDKRKVATRFLMGLAVPYGNSEVLPYAKQYFAGGTTGIRAFRIRGIGPGSYIPESSDFNNSFDRTGDMRLEANIEYRFPIYSYLKGALFLDAGNVWTLKADKPGSKFELNDFWQEIAMGIGFGTRLDFTYFILRLDTSMPIYRPDKPLEDRWVTDKISLFDKAWRSENINLSLGIGYPF